MELVRMGGGWQGLQIWLFLVIQSILAKRALYQREKSDGVNWCPYEVMCRFSAEYHLVLHSKCNRIPPSANWGGICAVRWEGLFERPLESAHLRTLIEEAIKEIKKNKNLGHFTNRGAVLRGRQGSAEVWQMSQVLFFLKYFLKASLRFKIGFTSNFTFLSHLEGP